MSTPGDPDSYPAQGSFSELLNWHIEIWGTAPGCSTSRPNASRDIGNLAVLIHPPAFDPESAARLLRNWKTPGWPAPTLKLQDRIERLYEELFGDDPNLSRWRRDLEAALEKGRALVRAQQAAKKATRRKKAERKTLTTVVPASAPPPTSHSVRREEEIEDYFVAKLVADGASAAEPVDGFYPEGYPRNGTYSELLNWHLKVWGTRPGCGLQEPNALWDMMLFARQTHEGIFWADKRHMERNLKDWLSHGHPVSPYSTRRVELELFGNDRRLAHWRNDLRDALLKAGGKFPDFDQF